MVKRYAKALSDLSKTYSWALESEIGPLVKAILASTDLPMVAVGSGGSFSAAHLACYLHQRYSGRLAKPITPLELLSSQLCLRSMGVMVLSAGGNNADIVTATENLIVREPRRCTVLCLNEASALYRLVKPYRYFDVVSFRPPTGKEGFLATNSLLALAVLLVRAYNAAYIPNERLLPSNFEELMPIASAPADALDVNLSKHFLWDKETLVVLYGQSVSAAAFDLESKFSEAALANVQLSDFRNFAHGRHYWLAKRGVNTGVLAICSRDDRELCDKTLRLIPSDIPRARLSLPTDGPTASIAAMVAVLQLVGSAGTFHKVDPGRPGVPRFGRQIYHLKALRSFNQPTSLEHTSVARKLDCDSKEIGTRDDFPFWHDSYVRFVHRLESQTYGAVVFDYDGTLCDEHDRFKGVGEDITSELIHLLDNDSLIGIATGRGGSVRTDLRRAFPRRFWRRIFVAYYNGSYLAALSQGRDPKTSSENRYKLESFGHDICCHPVISEIAECKVNAHQVSVWPHAAAKGGFLWNLIHQIATSRGLVAVRSSHSIDIVNAHVSKRCLLEHIKSFLPDGQRMLTIGDKGKWPGNDFELLGTPYSLSVDEVSADPDTCWNIAPHGHRGVQATLAYLSWLSTRPSGGLRLSVGIRRA